MTLRCATMSDLSGEVMYVAWRVLGFGCISIIPY